MLSRSQQRGASLVGLLVGMTAGLVVVTAGLGLLSTAMSAGGAHLLRVRLHQDLQSTMDAIARDLTRAGGWALADEVAQASATLDLQLTGTRGSIGATLLSPADATPGAAFAFPNAAAALRGATLVVLHREGGNVQRHDLAITGVPAPDRLALSIPDDIALARTHVSAGSWAILNPFAGVAVSHDGTCVLMRYDLDGDGVQDEEEHFGFRLNASRTTIQATTTARDCVSGNWDAFTDPSFLRMQDFEIRRLRPARTGALPIEPAIDTWRIGMATTLVRERQAGRSLHQFVQSRNAALQ